MASNDRTNTKQDCDNLPSHSSAANAEFITHNSVATNKDTTFILTVFRFSFLFFMEEWDLSLRWVSM